MRETELAVVFVFPFAQAYARDLGRANCRCGPCARSRACALASPRSDLCVLSVARERFRLRRALEEGGDGAAKGRHSEQQHVSTPILDSWFAGGAVCAVTRHPDRGGHREVDDWIRFACSSVTDRLLFRRSPKILRGVLRAQDASSKARPKRGLVAVGASSA